MLNRLFVNLEDKHEGDIEILSHSFFVRALKFGECRRTHSSIFRQCNSSAAPFTAPPLASFAQKDFHLDAMFAGGEIQVDGQLGAPIAQVVPEPRLVGLVLAGPIILLLVVARRRGLLQSTN